MAKMRVVQVTRPKGPLTLAEREIPEPGPGTVRVRVEACGICHSDWFTKSRRSTPFATVGHGRAISWSSWYIDSLVQDPAAELARRGGAKVILATVTSGKAMTSMLEGLAPNGRLLIIGAADTPVEVPAGLMIGGRRSISGWPSGTSIDSQDCLAFSARTGIRPMTELYPLERAAEAYDRMISGKARFRVVLTIR
jgi:D-arabinose 1-dehydrogenase-like Zn-dependent alcohol dehydrogenase